MNVTQPHPDGAVCDTTSTPRRYAGDCTCDTYAGNLGPCADDKFEKGANGRCAYCDHEERCHKKQKRSAGSIFARVFSFFANRSRQ